MVVSTNVDLSSPTFVLLSKGIRSKQDILFARGLIVNTLAVLKGITQKLRLQTSDSDPENLYPVQRHNPLRRNNKAPLPPPPRTLLETVTFQRNRESHSLNQAFSEARTFQEWRSLSEQYLFKLRNELIAVVPKFSSARWAFEFRFSA